MGISVDIVIDSQPEQGMVALTNSTTDENFVEIRLSSGNHSLVREVRIEDLRLALRKLTAK